MRPLPAALLGVLVVTMSALSACATVGEYVDDLRDQTGRVTADARYCLAITRALAALDGGTTPEEAVAAAEEVLATVPSDLREDAEVVADALRRARDGDRRALDDPDVRQHAERLRERTRDRCDPRR